MGGGKGQTSTSSVSIPPQVLAEYQSVNNKANTTANTPFTPYSSDPNAFVAPLTGTQQAGIANTNAAVGTAQPYYDQATGQLISAQNSAVPFYGQAQGDVQGAQTIGDLLGSSSYGAIAGAQAGAQPYNAAAGTDYQSAYNSAQPYNAGATGLAVAGAQAVDPSQLNSQAINQYLSPYLGTVLQGTAGILNQQNQQQQAGQLGNAINQGAFGGDRAGIAAANLEQQQNLANSQIYSGILNQGYNTALSTAEGQQQLGLGAAQANRAALQNASTQIQGLGQQQYSQGMGLGTAQQGLGQQTYAQGANTAQQLAALGQQQFGQGITAAGQEAGLGAGLYGIGSNTSQGLANLGTASQTAALQGAQAQLGAGQVEQQTQQAGDTALYNQFLQQQSYPFQVDQFLANIAEGTGALSGSTTTTTQPGGFFSDERLKENIRPVGKTFDGQKIYAYNYKGDPRTQVGLIAQEVEKKHPEAVGGHMGFKTVDYGTATDKAAKRGKFASGGRSSDDVHDDIMRRDEADVDALRSAHDANQMFGKPVDPILISRAMDAAARLNRFNETNGVSGPHTGQGMQGLTTPSGTPDPYQTMMQGMNRGGMARRADGGEVDYDPTWSGFSSTPGLGSVTTPSNDDSGSSPFFPAGSAPSSDATAGKPTNLAEAFHDVFNPIFARLEAQGPVAERPQAQLRATKAYGGAGLALPGVDPNYISALLQAQNQSYAPFGNSGLYGGQAGSAPRGGSSYVPAANLPVSQLQVAKAPTEAPQSGLSQIKQIGDAADTIHKGVDQLHSKNSGAKVANDVDDALDQAQFARDAANEPYKRGGRLHRADGGVNDDSPEGIYDDPTGLKLKIPNDHPTAKLQTAQPPGQGQSGLGALGDLVGIGASIASFFANGGSVGRAGFAEGGSPDDPVPGLRGNSHNLALIRSLLTDNPDIDSTDDTPMPPMGLGAAAPPPAQIAAPKALASTSIASPKDLDDAVRMVYGEAGGESDLGKIAALQVFLNRAKNSGKPLSSEIMAPHQSEAMTNGVKLDPQSATYQKILHNIVMPVLSGDAPNPIGNDTHFLNPDLQAKLGRAQPKFAQGEGQRIGHHVFYMNSGGRAGFADDGDPTQAELDTDDAPLSGDGQSADPNSIKKALQLAQDLKSPPANNNVPNEPDAEAYSAPPPSNPTNLLPSGLSGANDPSSQSHGFLGGLGQRLAHPGNKPDLIVPILEGLAAMGTAPTRHLGVALAAGLGAGAQGYQSQREYQQTQQALNQSQQKIGIERLGMAGRLLPYSQSMFDSFVQKENGTKQLPDGTLVPTTYINRKTGEKLTDPEYAQLRSSYLGNALSGISAAAGSGDAGGLGGIFPTLGQAAPAAIPGQNASAVPATPATPAAASPPQAIASVAKHVAAAPHSNAAAVDKANSGQYGINSFYPAPPDDSAIPPEQRIATLQQQANTLRARGGPGDFEAAAQMQDQIGKMQDGTAYPLDATGKPSLVYAQWAAQKKIADQQAAQANELKNQKVADASHFYDHYNMQKQAMDSVANVAKDTKLDTNSPAWASTFGALGSVPGLEGIFADPSTESASQIKKANMGLLSVMKATGTGAGSRAMATTEKLISGSGNQPTGPGATYSTITNAKALLAMQNDNLNDFNKVKNKVTDSAAFDRDWHAEPAHSLDNYHDQAVKQTPFFKGMTADDIGQYLPVTPAPTPQNLRGKDYIKAPNGQVFKVTPTKDPKHPYQLMKFGAI